MAIHSSPPTVLLKIGLQRNGNVVEPALDHHISPRTILYEQFFYLHQNTIENPRSATASNCTANNESSRIGRSSRDDGSEFENYNRDDQEPFHTEHCVQFAEHELR